MLAKALDAAFLMFDGKVIVSCLKKDVFDEQNATNLDTDGIVDALRIQKVSNVLCGCMSIRRKEPLNVPCVRMRL